MQELAKVHGGAVRVESSEARGSSFIVTIPKGKDHLPQNRIGGPDTMVSSGVRLKAMWKKRCDGCRVRRRT